MLKYEEKKYASLFGVKEWLVLVAVLVVFFFTTAQLVDLPKFIDPSFLLNVEPKLALERILWTTASAAVLAMLAYVGIFSSALDTLQGGEPPGSGSKGGPKTIFDHLRNYFLASTVVLGGWFAYNTLQWGSIGYLIIFIGFALALLNLLHGLRATIEFLDAHVPNGALEGLSKKIWDWHIPKLPIVFLIPLMFALFITSIAQFFDTKLSSAATMEMLCADEGISKSVKKHHCLKL